MPKVYTYNAEFNPISFVDRIAPLKLYKEEYDKQQEAYEKLLEETNNLGALKDIPMDSDSYAVYKKWNDDLVNVTDRFSKSGLLGDIRNDLLDIRKRKISEIDPLLEKQKKRAELISEQRKYNQVHQNSMFDVDYNEVPLSQISPDSSFNAYNLDDRIDNTAKMIYSNILTNNGVDTTDYNKIRSQYNYNNLSDKKKAVIDDIIDVSRSTAEATYKAYKDTEDLKRYQYSRGRYRGTGSSNGSGISSGGATQVKDIERVLTGNGKKKGSFTMPIGNGCAAKVSTDAAGNVTVIGIDGKPKSFITGARKDGESDENYLDRITKEIANAYFGHELIGSMQTNSGENITVLKDNVNGRTVHFIIDNKGKIKPINNINDMSELLTEYRNKTINYNSGLNVTFNNKRGKETTPYSDAGIVDDEHPINTYNSLSSIRSNPRIDAALANMGISEEEYSDMFNDGFVIVEYPYLNNKGETVATTFMIKHINEINNGDKIDD